MKSKFKDILSNFWFGLPHITIRHKKHIKKMREKYNFAAPVPSIICSSCIGGLIYHNLGLKFMSPTINLWIDTHDFVKFVGDLKKYLSLDLEFEGNTDYPVGILGDIKIHFNHYKSNDDALAKWNERKKRIDFENLYIITSDERLSDKELQRLNQVECKRLIIFTALDKSYIKNTYQMKRYKKNGYINQYSNRDFDGFREFEKTFDYAKWLNGESIKKIAFVFPNSLPMPPVKGGAAETLVNHIIKCNEATNEYDITVCCIADTEAQKVACNYKHTRFIYITFNKYLDNVLDIFRRIMRKIFRISLQRDWLYIIKVKSNLKRDNYEFVIIENAQHLILRIKKAIDTKLYYHLHNNYLYKGAENSSKILKACDGIVAVSGYIKNQILTIDNTAGEKIFVLENCIDTYMFNKENRITLALGIRKKYLIPSDYCLFIYCGRIIPQKGVRELVEAFKNIKGNVKLMLVGDSWYSTKALTPFVQDIRNLTKDLEDKIIFTGFIEYKKLPAYYAAADVCIVPSVVEEGSSMVINEALCSGIPVIATDSGGIIEKINDACSITVVRGNTMVEDLARAMQYLYDNPDLRKQMGENGSKYMERKNIEYYYSSFKEIFK